MPRIAAISLARLSLRNIPRNKLIRITNIVIFIALFAVIASVISLFFEKKIEELNKQLSNEFGNEIIYNHWLSETPKNIRNIESLLSQISREHNFLIYFQGLNDALITDTYLIYNPITSLYRFNSLNLDFLKDSLKDAIIISSSHNDIEEIKKTKKLRENILDNYYSILDKSKKNYSFFVNKDSVIISPSHDDIEEIENLHESALLEKSDLINNLQQIINLNINFNLNYYSKKKSEIQSKISKIKKEIKIMSKNESRSIFIAFIIQLIIFAIIQFFEFGFELVQNRSRGKK